MSEIKTKLLEDIKEAMKARNQEKLLTLRTISSEIKRLEVDTRKELTDADIIQIFQKEIKKRRDAIEFAKTAQRQDIVDSNQSEINLIQAYLGEQISEEKLKSLISELIASGANNIGKIMGELNQKYKGKFEGKVASDIAKTLLG